MKMMGKPLDGLKKGKGILETWHLEAILHFRRTALPTVKMKLKRQNRSWEVRDQAAALSKAEKREVQNRVTCSNDHMPFCLFFYAN